jgi:hypothetical protein
VRPAQLPPIFDWLAGQVAYVQQVSDTEYSASCPQCGGQVHPNGEWPDRLRIFVDDKPLAWCRRCNYMRFADQGGESAPSREEIDAWAAKQRQREEARKRSAERALENLRVSNVHLAYHAALDDHARAYWRRRGVPDVWQDYWLLGWAHQHEFYMNGAPVLSDAATIPLVNHGGDLLNVKLRLEPTPPNGDKYRYQVWGQGQPLFLCEPDMALADRHVIAVEGEIKAMVVYATLQDNGACVVGLPGTRPSPDIIAQLQAAGRVTLVMDPGARKEAWDLAKAIGKEKVWGLVTKRGKIDDMILESHWTQDDLRHYLRYNAIKAG